MRKLWHTFFSPLCDANDDKNISIFDLLDRKFTGNNFLLYFLHYFKGMGK